MNAILIFCKSENEEQKSEMYDLLKTADITILHTFFQNVRSISKATYIGQGKCEEIACYLRDEPNIQSVIFSCELSVMQVRELEKIFDLQVLDRTDLILQIFLTRARSAAARLQIESALLKRQMNRLIGTNVHLTRQRAGVTNRGSGEKQLQLDRRLIKTRMIQIQKELKKLDKQRMTQRSSRLRSNLPIVALAGYTNAGKSTIMNGLLDFSKASNHKQVLQEDLLFATLDTSVRLIELPYGQSFLLVDTVGFLQNLPHELVQAFHSTLEDIKMAQLILQVIDASSSQYLENIDTTNQTLEEIDAANIPRLLIYNQCDKTDIHHPTIHHENMYISALCENDCAFLCEQICQNLFGPWCEIDLYIPFNDFSLQQKVRKYTCIQSQKNDENGTRIHGKVRKRFKLNLI